MKMCLMFLDDLQAVRLGVAELRRSHTGTKFHRDGMWRRDQEFHVDSVADSERLIDDVGFVNSLDQTEATTDGVPPDNPNEFVQLDSRQVSSKRWSTGRQHRFAGVRQ
jgi:hypothetical protein